MIWPPSPKRAATRVFERENSKQTAWHEDEGTDRSPGHRSMKIMATIHFELLPQLQYSRELAVDDCYLNLNLKNMLGFGPNEEVIAETETYCSSKDKLFYKKDIEMLVKRINSDMNKIIFSKFSASLLAIRNNKLYRNIIYLSTSFCEMKNQMNT